MSWLGAAVVPRTLGEALALRPDLLAAYRRLDDALDREPALAGEILDRCRARVGELVGVPLRSHEGAASADDVAVEFVEQFVLDPHGVTDELVARLSALLGARGVVALAQAVAVWEGRCRLARCFEVTAEL